MRAFRLVTILLSVALVVSLLLHVVLLTADSVDYRRWVYLQMALHLAGIWLLWHIWRLKLGALIAFAILSVLGIYINAVHLNYGNGPIVWMAPAVFLFLYGSLAVIARRRFASKHVEHEP